MKPAKLESWELARIAHRLEDEITERTTGRFSRTETLGDPADIDMLEHVMKILRWHSRAAERTTS